MAAFYLKYRLKMDWKVHYIWSSGTQEWTYAAKTSGKRMIIKMSLSKQLPQMYDQRAGLQ